MDYSNFLKCASNSSVSNDYSKRGNNRLSNFDSSNTNFKSVLNSNTKKFIEHSNENIHHDTKSNHSIDNSKREEFNKKMDELNEKAEKLAKHKSNGTSDEELEGEIKDILSELLVLLLDISKNENNDKVQLEENAQALVEKLIAEVTQGSSEKSNELQDILKLLSENTNSETMDSESLNKMKELLLNLSEKSNGNSEVQKSLKQDIDALVSKIDQNLNGDKNSVNANESLNNSYSQNQENSFGNSSEDSNSMLGDKASKEEKFLNSLLDDNSNSFENKIGMFSNRVQTNNNVANVENKSLTINQATFTDDLIQDVKFMTNNNMKELVVKVNPGNLGQVTIELVQEDGVMKANLKANTKETTALLSQNIAEIQKELTEKNIKISEVNIELYNEDTTFFSGNFGGEFSKENEKNNSNSKTNVTNILNEEQEDEDFNLAKVESNLDFLA